MKLVLIIGICWIAASIPVSFFSARLFGGRRRPTAEDGQQETFGEHSSGSRAA